jgi:hypothetical protein
MNELENSLKSEKIAREKVEEELSKAKKVFVTYYNFDFN